MTKTIEGLEYYGEAVTANVEFQVPFKDSWIVQAYFEETGIYLTENECMELFDKNHARLNAIRKVEGYE